MKRRHSRAELRELLGLSVAEDPRERLEHRRREACESVPRARESDEIFVVWSAARAEANLAYDAWCATPGCEAYLVYRAAEDRADAAERELALAHAA